MKKQTKLLMFSMVFILLFVSISSAQGITQINQQDRGLTISYPKYESYFKGEPYNLSVETYNKSTGQKVFNSSCEVKFWNNNGENLLDVNLSGQESYKYYIPQGSLGINESNQELNYNIYCEKDGIGGFADGIFEIEERGESNNEFFIDIENNVNLILMFLLFLVSLAVFIFTSYKTIGSIGIILAGLVLLFSGFQTFISALIVALGAYLGISTTGE